MTRSIGGPGRAVRVAPNRKRADEWAVVLAAADIPHWIRRRLDGWALIVRAPDAAAALESLDAYDRENAGEGTDRGDAAAPARPVTLVGVYVALLLMGLFAITGAREQHSVWFERGSADATRMVAGEWWRAVTALTLHADVPHLLGNALAGALLVTAVCQQLGPGVGLWLLLVAGAGGNALTAAVHRGGHVTVVASTGVFGAIGILAALRIVRSRRRMADRRREDRPRLRDRQPLDRHRLRQIASQRAEQLGDPACVALLDAHRQQRSGRAGQRGDQQQDVDRRPAEPEQQKLSRQK